jgi:GNAT superfamily N-acetyltransferase
MKICQINTLDKINEAYELLELHREELTTHKDIMILNPDIEKYQRLQDVGVLHALGLYDGDKIVGYSVNLLTNNMHYADLVYLQNDVLFIHPDYRKGRYGILLIKETELLALKLGAKMMLFHGKPNTNFSNLMPKLGYGVQDIMFSKILKEV